MSMTDPIADMLTRIRNAQLAGHASVKMPRSNIKVEIAKLLQSEGFLAGHTESRDTPQGTLELVLKYDAGNKSTIRGILRISTPSRRVYVGRDEIPRVRNGLGVAILTTSHGVLTDAQARRAGVGGEVLCHIW